MCSWAFAYISSLGCGLKSEHLQNLRSSVYWQLSQWTVAFYFCNIFRHKERFSSEMTRPSSNLSFLNVGDLCSHIGSVFKCLSEGFILTVTKHEPRKPVVFFPLCFYDTDTACLGSPPWEPQHQLQHALSQNCLWHILFTTQDNVYHTGQSQQILEGLHETQSLYKRCTPPQKKKLINTTLLNAQLKSSCYPHLYGN